MATLTPMLQVPDIRATIAWYVSVGFTLLETAEEEGELTWALLGYGEGRVMFNCGGHASDAPRRDADLYLQVENVDALFESLPRGVIVFEEPARHVLRNARVHPARQQRVLADLRRTDAPSLTRH